MTGPFGLLAIGLSFVAGALLPLPPRTKLWEMMLIGAGLGITGGLLDFAFGTGW